MAAAASFSGLRAICAMKQNGLNVACDFLLNLNLIGLDAGVVLVTCDDPSAHSSVNEQDSRLFARLADLPLLEPSTFQEAKEMTKWAFEISEKIRNVCLLRGVTRTSHARGNVVLGALPPRDGCRAFFDKRRQRITHPVREAHLRLHKNLNQLEELFAESAFNEYHGPNKPDLLIVTCGTGWWYSQEAVGLMRLQDRVGILKVGTTWPLPRKVIVENLKKAENVLFIEEVDGFLEGNVKELAADHSFEIGPRMYFGKRSGHVPVFGEMSGDVVIEALKKIFNLDYRPRDQMYEGKAARIAATMLPGRVLGFCPGCPHRASFWSIKNALQLDRREGFVTGDIGCYSLARGPSGFYVSKTSGAMGSGTGLASGFGKLDRYGFEQPVISMCGDSTFFHAAMPALANAYHNQANMVMAILDNSATAMTGFQPHPGVGMDAMGGKVAPVDISEVCRSFRAKVEVTDPFDLEGTKQKLLEALRDPTGVKVIIMRRKCEMLRLREEKPLYKVRINPERCIGEECGCNRFCTRVFKCPGLIWDRGSGKAMVDEVICAGCGVCTEVCPRKAIEKEEVR